MSFKKYTGKMVVHTPLHIGMGVVFKPFEYWVEGTKLFIGDFNKLLSDLDREKSEKLLEILKGPENVDFLTILKQLKMEEKKEEFIAHVFDFQSRGRPDIEAFISHPQWKKYIPGSSVKGAILTAIYYRELKRINFQFERLDKKDAKQIDEIAKELGRYIMIEDIEVPSDAFIIGRNIRKRRNGGDAGRFSFLECIKPGAEFDISIYVNEDKLKLSEIIDCVNEFYRRSLEKIKIFTGEIFSTTENNTMILQIGKFGGNFTKSFSEKIPKTFALINNKPAGWVSIKFEV